MNEDTFIGFNAPAVRPKRLVDEPFLFWVYQLICVWVRWVIHELLMDILYICHNGLRRLGFLVS